MASSSNSDPRGGGARESPVSETFLDHESRLVSVVCAGEISSARALKGSATARRLANQLGYRFLVDLSHAELNLSLADAYFLARNPDVEAMAGESITLVRPEGEHGEWFEFLALTAANAGIMVRAFPDRESALAALAEADEAAPQSSPKRDALILVVDGDPDNLALTSRVLSDAGYRVLEAATGREGLETAFEMQPELVLLDVVLPDGDGRESFRILRADSSLSRSLLALTSGVRTTVEGLGGRPDACLSRPISNKALLSFVEFLLRKGRTGQRPDSEGQEPR